MVSPSVECAREAGTGKFAADLDAASTAVDENTEWDEHCTGLHRNTCIAQVVTSPEGLKSKDCTNSFGNCSHLTSVVDRIGCRRSSPVRAWMTAPPPMTRVLVMKRLLMKNRYRNTCALRIGHQQALILFRVLLSVSGYGRSGMKSQLQSLIHKEWEEWVLGSSDGKEVRVFWGGKRVPTRCAAFPQRRRTTSRIV